MERKQRNILLGAISVVALVAAGAVFLGGFGRPPKLPATFTIKGVCLACQEEVEAQHAQDEHAPLICPQCSEFAVYPWLYCFDCSKRFVPALVRPDDGGPLRVPSFPVCPACGAQHFAAYIPDMPGQDPVGDAKLPNWSP